MRLFLFYSVLLLISCNVFAQSTAHIIDVHIEELNRTFKEAGITEYFFVRPSFPGASYVTKVSDKEKCQSDRDLTHYLFWKEGALNWVKRISNCGVSQDVAINRMKPVDFYITYLDQIEVESVARYAYISVDKESGKMKVYQMFTNHSARRAFSFYANSRSFQKRIDKFDLSNDRDKENLNYDSNNSLALVKLNNQCDKIINHLNEKGLFDRFIKLD